MLLESLNRLLFNALNATGSGPGGVASLEAFAQAPVWFLPVLLAGVWLFGARSGREAAVLAGLACCVAMAMAHLASLVIVHPRPFAMGLAPNLLNHVADSSFPSDHATLFFALAFAFIRRPVSGLPGLHWLLGGIGAAVGLARVALGVHFPLDIVGALLIGMVAALITDIGLRRLVSVLFAIGERIRSLVGPLATRDRRELEGTVHARPSR